MSELGVEILPKRTPRPKAKAVDVSPMGLIQAALSNGSGMDTVERLVALQTQMMAREAEAAFNAALCRAQASMSRVQADATNPQTHSKYATYAAMDRALRPIYTGEGFSLSFNTKEAGESSITIEAILSHAAGHSRTYQVPMPNDGKGAKGSDVMTRTHAQGAAVSYGMRYLLKAIFNVAVGEEDRDGNTGQQNMPEDRFQGHLKAIRESKTIQGLQSAYASAYAEAVSKADKAAIIKCYEEMKTVLGVNR